MCDPAPLPWADRGMTGQSKRSSMGAICADDIRLAPEHGMPLQSDLGRAGAQRPTGIRTALSA